MTSDSKIAANRNNARKSTGPRTEAGIRRSRRNALRHGLAVAIGSQPSFREDIESLAQVLVGDSAQLTESARDVAEAELDLLRIRKVRASYYNKVIADSEASLSVYANLSEALAKLERYERRARSRRKISLQALLRSFG